MVDDDGLLCKLRVESVNLRGVIKYWHVRMCPRGML